ncbi:MAG: thiamine phosphate synthase [Ahrensia sp.]|nr:thiamine phosphate synthase [Ahrensia sp.]
MTQRVKNRCRLVLITPSNQDAAGLSTNLKAAVSAGDVASIIVPQYDMSDDIYQELLSHMVEIGQTAGAAVIAAGDTRIAGRCNADGLHVSGGFTEVRAALKEFGQKWIVGCGGPETRHAALTLGEENPDYVFFGRFGQDTHAAPHKRNLELADWWSKVVAVPCILMGGNDLATLADAAGTGADFVALSTAILSDGVDAARVCADANSILSAYVFEDDAA